MRNVAGSPLARFLFLTSAAYGQDGPTVVIQGGRLLDSTTGVARPLAQLWIRGVRVPGERAAGSNLKLEELVGDRRKSCIDATSGSEI